MADMVRGTRFAGHEVPLIVALRAYFEDGSTAFNRELAELEDDELEWFREELQKEGFKITPLKLKLLPYKKADDDGPTYGDKTPVPVDVCCTGGYSVGQEHPAMLAKE